MRIHILKRGRFCEMSIIASLIDIESPSAQYQNVCASLIPSVREFRFPNITVSVPITSDLKGVVNIGRDIVKPQRLVKTKRLSQGGKRIEAYGGVFSQSRFVYHIQNQILPIQVPESIPDIEPLSVRPSRPARACRSNAAGGFTLRKSKRSPPLRASLLGRDRSSSSEI